MCIVFTNILDILLRFNEIVIVRWSRGHQVRHDKFSLTSLFSLYPCGFPPGTPVSSGFLPDEDHPNANIGANEHD